MRVLLVFLMHLRHCRGLWLQRQSLQVIATIGAACCDAKGVEAMVQGYWDGLLINRLAPTIGRQFDRIGNSLVVDMQVDAVATGSRSCTQQQLVAACLCRLHQIIDGSARRQIPHLILGGIAVRREIASIGVGIEAAWGLVASFK